TEADVRARAFVVPLTSPAFPPGPYRFADREFFIITYRTDPDALKDVIPEPLEFHRASRQVRVHPHAGFDRIRRLHGDGTGHTGSISGRNRRVRIRDVSGRRGADRRRARALGFPEKARLAQAIRRDGHVARRPQIWTGSGRDRDHGVQASHARSGADSRRAYRPALSTD